MRTKALHPGLLKSLKPRVVAKSLGSRQTFTGMWDGDVRVNGLLLTSLTIETSFLGEGASLAPVSRAFLSVLH